MSVNRTIAVAQGKGGVGKTSLVCNVAGLAAAAGSRVLIVDLDQQGNVARDLGYKPDSGEELLTSLITGAPLPLLVGVRDRLDVVAGGPALGDLAAVMTGRAQRGAGDLGDVLERKLSDVASDYDLIVLDTPPGDRIVVTAALAASRAVVIPTRSDEASLDGVTRIAERFMEVRARNPHLRLAGVVLFAISSRTTRLERDVRRSLEGVLGDAAPVFDTRIRHLDSAAADARRRGLLVHELEQAAIGDRVARIDALRQGSTPTGGLYARDSSGLAGDYANLAQEILTRVVQLEQEMATVS
ncbi:ParA family protein [Microbacterium trichothecenolyticum]|uniref:ParA family protein n=1 Tax=Microbacterium trichothecenolyticum TaxID=69370 RepID=UPI00286A885A|nr:ParA family protein [Microbacterium trichothecenolyticum]